MSDEKYPSQLAERFQIRLPDGMRDRLRAEAERNKRSMNAEIVARLEQTLKDDARAVVQDRFREAVETGISEPREPGEPLRYEPEPVADVSDFEREFVMAQQELVFRLLRKHGMNPVGYRDLMKATEDGAAGDAPTIEQVHASVEEVRQKAAAIRARKQGARKLSGRAAAPARK